MDTNPQFLFLCGLFDDKFSDLISIDLYCSNDARASFLISSFCLITCDSSHVLWWMQTNISIFNCWLISIQRALIYIL